MIHPTPLLLTSDLSFHADAAQLKIDLAALREVEQHWRGIAATVGVNWLIKPFSTALLRSSSRICSPFQPADEQLLPAAACWPPHRA